MSSDSALLPIRFEGLTRPYEDYFERVRKPLPDGDYSHEQLAEVLIDGWIPYVECHQCSRHRQCPYPQPHPANPARAREIQCGVAQAALRNFIRTWWPRLACMSQGEQQHFVDALFHWTTAVLHMEAMVAQFTDRDFLDYWGPNFAPHVMELPITLREDLDRFAYHLRELPQSTIASVWVFVEGESEKRFLDRLRARRFFGSTVAGIETYGGRQGARSPRVPVPHVSERGYTVMVQLDADGKTPLVPSMLEKAAQTHRGILFTFARDFEAAFPPEVLSRALARMDVEINASRILESVENLCRGSLMDVIRREAGRKVSKPELALHLADEVYANWGTLMRRHPTNEIVRWLAFLVWGDELTAPSNSHAPSNDTSD